MQRVVKHIYSVCSCSIGYYGYPNCIPCDCDVNGTEGDICHVNGGQCPCKENYIGKKCDMCQRGYYDFPSCGGKYVMHGFRQSKNFNVKF